MKRSNSTRSQTAFTFDFYMALSRIKVYKYVSNESKTEFTIIRKGEKIVLIIF